MKLFRTEHGLRALGFQVGKFEGEISEPSGREPLLLPLDPLSVRLQKET